MRLNRRKNYDLVGHTFGAIDVIDVVDCSLLLCKCRTCQQTCMLKRSYLRNDRALVGCRDCSRQKAFTTRSGMSKHPEYRKWKYLVKRWQEGEIELDPEWTRRVKGFQNYLRDMRLERFKRDDAQRLSTQADVISIPGVPLLTEAQVEEVRRLYATGFRKKKIAAMFDADEAYIRSLLPKHHGDRGFNNATQ